MKFNNFYSITGGMCYKLYGMENDSVTFSEAIQRCKNEKANLASLSDIYENGKYMILVFLNLLKKFRMKFLTSLVEQTTFYLKTVKIPPSYYYL